MRGKPLFLSVLRVGRAGLACCWQWGWIAVRRDINTSEKSLVIIVINGLIFSEQPPLAAAALTR